VEGAPESPELHLSLAKALCDEQRFREAAESFRKVIALRPTDLRAHIGLGAMLQEAGELQAATEEYVRILQAEPGCAEAYTNLGMVCQELGDLGLAIELQRQAVALAPEMAEAHNNLGSALSKQGNSEEALDCFRRVLALKADHAGAQFNIGHVYANRGDLGTAEEYYRQALACQPQSDTFRFYLGILHLLQGKFSVGWAEYEFRWGSKQLRNGRRDFSQPQWRGEALRGETILLHGEQGLGDTMQFARYATMVAERGGRVVLEVQPGVRRLIGGMDGVAQVLSRGDDLPEFAWHCPLMSLPLAFETELASIPRAVPYLRADEVERVAWANKLAGKDLRIGLAWGGDPKHTRERVRSIRLAELAPLTAIAGTRFYSLQKGPAAAQIREIPAGMEIVDLDAEQKDFADTAAIVANLDLVISIDTSVAHLAGAMGKPVWVLLHHAPDWRWMLDREDSPWYPTARLFRKSAGEGWDAVVERVGMEIEKLTRNVSGKAFGLR
jgi:Flp pilus assembly protein TadD